MRINRMQYIVEYFGKEIPRKLSTMDLNLVYVSKKQKYAVVYYDVAKGEKELLRQLQGIRGFKSVKESLFYDENVNIWVFQDSFF